MTDPLPRARTIDPLPRTVLAWQRTIISIAANALLLTVALLRAGVGIAALAVLVLAVAPIPAAVRREQSLLPGEPAPVAAWKLRLVTSVVLLLACAGALVAVLL